MYKCSNEDCDSEGFERETYGSQEFRQTEFLDKEGDVIDSGDCQYGDSDIVDSDPVKCSHCGARANWINFVPKTKKAKVKIGWKTKIE